MDLDVKGLAVGLGVSWSSLILITGWASIFGWGTPFVETVSSLYIGFAPTFIGGVVGAIWGFIDGAIGGAIIALVYNAIARRKRRA